MAEYNAAGFMHNSDPGEAPNGVAVPAGIVDDAGSRDPSSMTVDGAVSNAYANMREMESDVTGPPGGSGVGDPMNLPEKGY